MTADEFLKLVAHSNGRVVSTGDLNQFQISEAQSGNHFYVDSEGFGWVILDWSLTTDKDRERERKYFNK